MVFLAWMISTDSFTFCHNLLAVAEEGMDSLPHRCLSCHTALTWSLFPGPSNVTAGIENIQGNLGPFDILHSGKKVRKAGQVKENSPPLILSCSFVSKGSPTNQRALCLKQGTPDVHSVLLYSCPSQTNPGSIDKQCKNGVWSCSHAIASDGACTDHCVHSSYCL